MMELLVVEHPGNQRRWDSPHIPAGVEQTVRLARAPEPASQLLLCIGQIARRGSRQDHAVLPKRGVIAQPLNSALLSPR